jgi:hypothetical protein
MTQVIEAPLLEEDEMQLIYNWVDEIPLSRPKKNITRDFADGGMATQCSWLKLSNTSCPG